MPPPESQLLFEAPDPISVDMEHRAKRRLLWLHVATWATPSALALSLFLLLLIDEQRHLGLLAFFLDHIGHVGFTVASLGLLATGVGVVVYCGFLHAVIRRKKSGRDPDQRKGKIVWDTIGFVLLQFTVICAVIPTAIVWFSESK